MQNQAAVHMIDGTAYEFYMMPPGKALKIFIQLAKRALGPVGGAIDGVPLSLTELVQTKVNLSGLLTRLAENLDADWAHQIIMQILEHVRHQGGSPIVFEVEFMGKLFHMFKIVGTALEVNYHDFWQGLRAVRTPAPGPDQVKK